MIIQNDMNHRAYIHSVLNVLRNIVFLNYLKGKFAINYDAVYSRMLPWTHSLLHANCSGGRVENPYANDHKKDSGPDFDIVRRD